MSKRKKMTKKKYEDKTEDEKIEELRAFIVAQVDDQKRKAKEKSIIDAAHPLVVHFAQSEDSVGFSLFKKFIETIF